MPLCVLYKKGQIQMLRHCLSPFPDSFPWIHVSISKKAFADSSMFGLVFMVPIHVSGGWIRTVDGIWFVYVSSLLRNPRVGRFVPAVLASPRHSWPGSSLCLHGADVERNSWWPPKTWWRVPTWCSWYVRWSSMCILSMCDQYIDLDRSL